MPRSDGALLQLLRDHVRPLSSGLRDWDPVLDRVGDARVVLLGEATHGTLEFYRARAEITSRLIEEEGFTAVAAEADWPDAHRVHRFVRGFGEDRAPEQALGDFRRFPTWMWRNETVARFLRWLQARNARRPVDAQAGFYGLDLYSLTSSAEAVLAFLDRVDPDGAARARERYGCFDHVSSGPDYGRSVVLGLQPDCEDEVVAQLVELQERAAAHVTALDDPEEDRQLFAEQNARVVRNAAHYYRESFRGLASAWNLRDEHMLETLEVLLDRLGPDARVVVWAHNSHLGDALATQMAGQGELNLGELCRRRWPGEVVNLGFTTHTGTVSAARRWGGEVETRAVSPSLPGSWERLFHDVGIPGFLLDTRADPLLREALTAPRLQRMIGVIYAPHTERQSHYMEACLADQFDLVVHLDTTRAVVPLDRAQPLPERDAPKTWPSGF